MPPPSQAFTHHVGSVFGFLEARGIAGFGEPFVRIRPGGRAALRLFASPLRNFLEGYYLLWKILPQLGARRWEGKALLKFLLERGMILYLKEEVSRPEAVNKFLFLNAVSSFRDLGILSEETEGWGKRKKCLYSVTAPPEKIQAIGAILVATIGKNSDNT